MPKRKPAPKYCYWRGDILWARITVNNIQIRQSLRTGDVELARKRSEAIRAKAIAHKFNETEPLWVDAVTGWTEHIGDAVGASTLLRYDSSLRTVEAHFKNLRIKDIDSKMLGRFVVARRKELSPRNKPVSLASIKRDLSAIASVLDFAIEQDWCEINVARERSRRMKERREAITLPPDDNIEKALYPLTGGLEDMARFAIATGMRLDEILTLQRRNVGADSLFIPKAKGRNKSRTIYLSEEALAIIRRQPVSLTATTIFHHDGEVFSSVHTASSNFSRAVAKAQKLAQEEKRDFTPFTFHTLRHVFAVKSLKSGKFGLYELAKHLGHASVVTTERHYLRYLTPEEAKSVKDGTKHNTATTVPLVTKSA